LLYSCRLVSYVSIIDTPKTDINTLSLHDALPISTPWHRSKPYSRHWHCCGHCWPWKTVTAANGPTATRHACSTWTCCFMTRSSRSEEHTSELQSREKLVCRLLLEKNKLVYRTNIN